MNAAEDEFFSHYQKTNVKKDNGIKGFQMNAPITANTLPGMIGLELELEGRNLLRDGGLDGILSPKTKATWLAVPDGSLRAGMEYIFSTPVLEEELEYMLNELWRRFENSGTKFALSNRCSTHVHINMKGKTVNQVTGVLALWGVFEEALINWNGEERKINHFCLGMKDSETTLKSWDSFLRHGQMVWPAELKYTALNIATLPTLGSLEFRCGRASDKPKTPLLWARFLHRLVEFASDRYNNPQRLAGDISERGGYAIFMELTEDFPKFFEEVTAGYSVDEFNSMALRGLRTVQPVVMGYPWEEWLGLINREYVPNPFAKATPKQIRADLPRTVRIRPMGQEAIPPAPPAVTTIAGRVVEPWDLPEPDVVGQDGNGALRRVWNAPRLNGDETLTQWMTELVRLRPSPAKYNAGDNTWVVLGR